MVICVLVFAAVATVIWSILDRRRENYVTLYKWFRLFIRFALASQMIAYGMSKVIPVEMPFPYLSLLIRPYGTFLPMAILWLSIGSSPAYEIFAGCAEMLGGILLIFPRATMLGALICLVDVIQVFALNMTYDVPVKLFSFHLVLMALFLLAPEFSRLAGFFLSDRAVGPSKQPQLFGNRRANRIAFAAQIVLGVWLVGLNTYSSWSAWHTYGDGRPRSALYGLWNVDQFSIDGVLRSPLLTDYVRWRRAIFEVPDRMYFEGMDGSLARYGASINDNDKTLALTKESDQGWRASFHFQRLAQDQLILDGSMDGHTMHMQLRLVDLKNKFSLVKRRFHWIQEYPYTP
jgi:hypothetical protein